MGGGGTRISWRLLQDNKLRAGLALPNMEIYYHTANLSFLNKNLYYLYLDLHE